MRRDLGIPAPTDADRGSLVKTESMKALAEISDEDFALGELGEFVSSTELRIPEWETELARYAAAIPAADLAQDGVVGKHHVTLKYGLATSNAEDLRRLAASLPTMTLRLGATMVFPKPEADILVMRVFGEGLEEAHEQIQRYTPCQEDEQPYLPHVTLAYLKPGAGVRYAGDPALAGRAAIATELWFRPSTTSKLPDQALPLGVEDMQLAGIEEAWAKPLMISRPLRPLERAVNLHEIDRRCKLTATRMLQTVRPIGRQMAEAMVKACRECGEDNIQSLMDYRVPLQGKMASACKTYLADMFDFGQAQVREELARQHRQAQNPESDLLLAEPPRPIDNEKRARDVINLKADLLSRRWAERLKESAMNVMLAAARSGMPPGEAAQRIQEAADEITDRSSRQLVMNTLGDAFGLGRQVEAHRQRDYIGEAEYSAILDENTCDPCRQLDGRTGQLDEPAMQVPNPNCAGERYGSSCRCVLVFRYRGPSGGSGS